MKVPFKATPFLVVCSLVLSSSFAAAQGGITVSPARAAVVTSTQSQQFTASAGGVTWSVDKAIGGNSTVGTISSTGLYAPPAKAGTHTITATGGGSSGTATVYVTDLKNVFTYHNNNPRDSTNLQKLALSSTTITTTTFGK